MNTFSLKVVHMNLRVNFCAGAAEVQQTALAEGQTIPCDSSTQAIKPVQASSCIPDS